MRKLLIATDCFLPRWDGISSFLNELIPRLQNKYKVTVIAPDFGKLKTKYDARIIKFKTLKLRLGDIYPSKINFKKLSSEIKKTDVVFVQSFGFIGLFTTILAKIHKKPLLRYHHTNEWELFPNSTGVDFLKLPINIGVRLLGKILYNLFNVTMVSSAGNVELLNAFGVKKQKRIVHLGIDTKLYSPESKSVAKHALGIDPRTFVVGYAGRLGHEKDLKTLYRAFVRLAKKHDDVILLVVGGGNPELENLFTGKENVNYIGPKDNLAPYYQAMDVYVLPSLTETTSLTTMEAMSCGCAVVVTPVGFIKEYINDGTNGLLFPKKNSYVLYSKLEYLKQNNEAKETLGRNARETIVNEYSWKKTTKNITQVIDELMPFKKSRNLAK